MAHVFGIAEGRKAHMDPFIRDLTERCYDYKLENGQQGIGSPNVREIKLLDISLPEECMPSMLNDLSPFAENSSSLRGKALFATSILRKIFKLRSIYDLKPKENLQTRIRKFVSNHILSILEPEKITPKEKPIEYKATGEIRKTWINFIPIGWYPDKHLETQEEKIYWGTFPKGGELI